MPPAVRTILRNLPLKKHLFFRPSGQDPIFWAPWPSRGPWRGSSEGLAGVELRDGEFQAGASWFGFPGCAVSGPRTSR